MEVCQPLLERKTDTGTNRKLSYGSKTVKAKRYYYNLLRSEGIGFIDDEKTVCQVSRCSKGEKPCPQDKHKHVPKDTYGETRTQSRSHNVCIILLHVHVFGFVCFFSQNNVLPLFYFFLVILKMPLALLSKRFWHVCSTE